VIHPSLTTVKYYYKEAGQMGAQRIIKLVNGEEVEKLTLSNYELIERALTTALHKKTIF